MDGSTRIAPVAGLGILLTIGCGSPTDPTPSCTSDDTVLLAHSLCLDFRQAGDLSAYRTEIQEEVERTIGAVTAVMPIGPIRVRILPDPGGVIPEIGLGGYAPGQSEVRIFADPETDGLTAILRTHLVPILAHEIHHAERWRSVGYGSTLFAAAVSEGLADHFAVQVAAIAPPPWAMALAPADLEEWTARVLRSSGAYTHSDWFVGTSPDIPRWTGYAVGYELVRRYLEANPGATAASLVAEPAPSFRPH